MGDALASIDEPRCTCEGIAPDGSHMRNCAAWGWLERCRAASTTCRKHEFSPRLEVIRDCPDCVFVRPDERKEG